MRVFYSGFDNLATDGRRGENHTATITALLALLALAVSAGSARAIEHFPLCRGLGDLHHPVSTTSSEAQAYFDQGLELDYAFNHDAAVSSFRRAAELDPNMAMAHWGEALAFGPNYNSDVDRKREREAYDEIQKAVALSTNSNESERSYIEALARRYSRDPSANLAKLAVDYKNAMAQLAQKYPDDPDALTLYAESLMDLKAWRLWNNNGTPAEGTEEIVAILDRVLRMYPQHLGANHYYIHALEASRHPETALPSAKRLSSLAPAAGHLVHMPAHIYFRLGDFDAAADANIAAIKADREFIAMTDAQGKYAATYLSHNLYFLVASYTMGGRLRDALKTADELMVNLQVHAKDLISQDGMAGMRSTMDYFEPLRTLILLRFNRWDDVIESHLEDREPISSALNHYARGVAYANKNKLELAEGERAKLLLAVKSVHKDASYGFDRAIDMLKIPDALLAASIARAKKDDAREIEFLRRAVAAQDALSYGEPPPWYYPVRESLGGAFYRDGRYAEAEAVFRDDLTRNPRNPRSLFGLLEALKAEGRTSDAAFVQQAFDTAWKHADVTLRIEDL